MLFYKKTNVKKISLKLKMINKNQIMTLNINNNKSKIIKMNQIKIILLIK